jgi:hypothetical protein
MFHRNVCPDVVAPLVFGCSSGKGGCYRFLASRWGVLGAIGGELGWVR